MVVTQRQLNYSKRSLKEKSEETKKFIQATENAVDTDLAKGHKKRLVELLQEFTNQIEEFDAANPEGEESNTLFETYVIVKNEAQNMLALLESKIEGKEIEIERLEREKEANREEKRRYKEMEMDLEKEKLRMEHEAKIRMEEIEIEKLRIRAENKIETIDTNAKFGNVKLPKLELPKFDGDIMNFQAFWDAFDSTINKNTRLNPIDKFTYLKSQLTNQAREVISGLDITDANYKVAIDLLHERYGKKHLLIQAHYARLKEIPTASPYYDKLRQTTDEIEKHIRSLESLGEAIESNLMVSLIVSKLPLSVVIKLKEYKNDNQPWTVKHLREELTKYMDIQEEGEKLTQLNKNNSHHHKRDIDQSSRRNYHNHYRMSTGSLAVGERTLRQPTCIYCGKKHWSDQCKLFSDIQSRKNKIIGCCYNCLKKGHQIKDCEINRQCVYCKTIGQHHRSLCQKQFGNVEETTTMVNQEESAKAVLSGACIDKEENALVAVGDSVIMQTALVEVTNPQDNIATSSKARLIMDSGSQRSYVSEELAKELGLKKISKNFLSIHTFGSTKPKEIETHVAKLGIVLKSGFTMNIHVNIVPQVTGFIERKPIKSKDIYEKIKLYDLADVLPTQLERSKLEILIGNDYYNDIVSMKKINVSNGLYLLQSKLGWILSGRIKTNQINDSDQSLLMLTNSSSAVAAQLMTFTECDESLCQPSVEEFWKLETLGISEDIDNEDDMVMDEFNDTVEFRNARYQVRWPWRDKTPELPDNYHLSLGRLKSQMKRLNRDPALMQTYDNIINEQLQKGIIEKVDRRSDDMHPTHYIPHHPIINPGKTTTKVRIVYDASAKSKKSNASLNECLLRGPVILEDMCGLLMRFRTKPIVVVADIEKAFLQVGLQDKERDVTRFLWLKDITKKLEDSNLEIYRFTRVPFGVISSQFLLAATILHHLSKSNTPIANQLKNDIYVDNIITGCNTPNNALNIYHQGKKIFEEMSMRLREWRSNSAAVNKEILPEDMNASAVMKILGLQWNSTDDTLRLGKSTQIDKITTKRVVLKELASIFDPLGLFAPVTLKAKLFLQKLWKAEYDWDDPVEDTLKSEWKIISDDIHQLDTIYRERYVGNGDAQLLCFCDASGKAYSTTVYLRTQIDGIWNCNLIFAKSRITPTKKMSIPRLELLAMVIGVQSLKFVEKHLQLPITKKIIWTDSQCVLHWIKSTKPLSTFVTNRIKEIKNANSTEFRYVSTTCNPADIATRGLTSEEIKDSKLWWEGPAWITKDYLEEWPSWDIPQFNSDELNEIKNEEKQTKVLFEVSNINQEKSKTEHAITKMPFGIKIEDYSSIKKLTRITAWVFRFINNIKQETKIKGELISEEIIHAEVTWIKAIQKETYLKILSCNKTNKTDDVRKLNLKIDHDGIIRCYGRYANADLPETTIQPIYLPKSNPWTHLLIMKYHNKLMHAGPSHTLSQIRTRYWIPHGKAEVKRILSKCSTCRKYQGGPFQMPKMSAWPNKKISRSPPFSYTGLDYIGPLYVKDGEERTKVWICLFTCAVVRAVHLEIVMDLTPEEFLMSLRRFIARRGTPIEITLDNAPQFKVTKTAIDKAWEEIVTNQDVMCYTTNQKIRWNFIIEYAPWIGGFYERLVAMVKSAIRKSIGKILLNKIQLITFITEAEAVINSRPIVHVLEDLDIPVTLTPAHFLTPITTLGTPESNKKENQDNDPDYEVEPKNSAEKLLESWRKGQKHLDCLWKLWNEDYLLGLRERYQSSINQPRVKSVIPPQLNQVVHIHEKLPRGTWKIGIIHKLIESHDGEVRAAEIRIPSGKLLRRPINLLYPLETVQPIKDDEEAIEAPKNTEEFEQNVNTRGRKSTRKSALEARDRIKGQSMIDEY